MMMEAVSLLLSKICSSLKVYRLTKVSVLTSGNASCFGFWRAGSQYAVIKYTADVSCMRADNGRIMHVSRVVPGMSRETRLKRQDYARHTRRRLKSTKISMLETNLPCAYLHPGQQVLRRVGSKGNVGVLCSMIVLLALKMSLELVLQRFLQPLCNAFESLCHASSQLYHCT